MSDFDFITYETLADSTVARVMLNRPSSRNAQNRGLLVELDEAMRMAEQDDRVRVVILGGMGLMFSAGHDMGSAVAVAERGIGPGQHPTMRTDGGSRVGVEKRYLQEWRFFFDNTWRWRNLKKITIAEVHGPVFSAGLMLMWACDLIVAADDVVFSDVVGTRLGMCGVEYFAHPWELGPRRAKELLLTGDSLDVEEAKQIGMVSKIFPRETLQSGAMAMALKIATLPTMAALLIKESVNQSIDAQGFYTALNASFSLHQVNHAYWADVHEDGYPCARPEDGVQAWNSKPTAADSAGTTPS